MKADKPEDHQTIFFLRTSNYLIIYQRRNKTKTEKYNIHVKVIRHNPSKQRKGKKLKEKKETRSSSQIDMQFWKVINQRKQLVLYNNKFSDLLGGH